MPGINIKIDENGIGKHCLCIVCLLLLRAPVQTECGHRCCMSCVEEKRRSSNVFICPEDGTAVTEVFPDRFVEREVLSLNVTCFNKTSGCSWKGFVRHFEEHIQSCHFHVIKCPNSGCDAVVQRRNLDAHLQTECKFAMIKCDACGTALQLESIEKHATACPAAMVTCNQCGKDVVREQLIFHQKHDCDEATAICRFARVGCPAKCTKGERRSHEIDAQLEHISYLLDHVLQLETQVLQLKERQSTGEDVSDEEMEVETRLGAANDQIRLVSGSKYSSLPNQSSSQQTAMNVIKKQISDLDSRVTGIFLTIEDLKKQVSEINVRRVDAMRDSLRKVETRLTSLETSEQMKAVNTAEQEETICHLQDASYNGTLIWPIPQFMKARHDSIVGKNTSIYSPYFYTGKYGYKMRLRIYLNGDGIGKGSHISLFFVICKGKYDSLLQWPFKQRVTMTILDQNRVRDVSDSFKPDPKSSSFQKPKKAANIASGCPLFMPISSLDTNAYTADDALFVKVEVDMTGLNH